MPPHESLLSLLDRPFRYLLHQAMFLHTRTSGRLALGREIKNAVLE